MLIAGISITDSECRQSLATVFVAFSVPIVDGMIDRAIATIE